MALREKTPSSGWRSFSGSSRSTRDGGSFLTPNRRGAIYITLTLFFLWLVFGHGADDSAPALTSSLRNQAVRLTGGVLDEEIYGPPVPKHKQRPLHPQNSAFVPLHSWKDGVPETTVHGLSGGWALLDNVILMNGTVFIVTNDVSKFPPLGKMFSTGVPMESDPNSWRGRDTTPREMQFVDQIHAHNLFGDFGSRIKGTTFLCNDAPQFASHYYHYIAEILFGMWRTYSMLDLNIPPSGLSETLVAPRRFMFPHIPSSEFHDYSGLSEYITRAVFPSMAFEFRETWMDRNLSGRPFILDRVVLGDRIAAEISPQWNKLYKYAAPAFELPGSGVNFWGPVRRALVQFIGMDKLLSDSTSKESVQERKKTVITYVSRQGWGRRTLREEDHNQLVKALRGLERRHGYEVNIVTMDQMSRQEQLILAARTTVMMGVHGNGLTHALWMDPSRKPLLLEFFADKGVSFDYEYPTRQLGITYYGWWGSKHFSHRQLPEYNVDGADFQGTDIRIDGNAVAELVHAHVTGTLVDEP